MIPGPAFDALALHAASASSPDILRWIEAKAPRAIGDWNEIGQAEYARAFTVAGTAGYDVVGDIYAAMLDVIRRGGTEQDFADLITPILVSKGWLPGPGQTIGSRVALIYDTNLRVARSIGRWSRVQSVAHVMPYLLGTTVGDRRVRDEHTAFGGICLPVNHWFWQEFWPPLYFRCRCDVIQLTRSQFARRGLALTSEADARARAELIRPQSWGRNVALVNEQVMQERVGQANADRVPGAPVLSTQQLGDRGRSEWQAIMGLALQELLTGLAQALGPR